MSDEGRIPHDINAEESVIASVLVDDEAFALVEPLVVARDFHSDPCRWAFEASRELWTRRETINQVTLAHEMSRRDTLQKAGGYAWISRLVAELPTPIGVEHYAQIVHRDGRYRDLIQAGASIVSIAHKGGHDLESTLRKAEELVASVANDSTTIGGFRPLRDLLDAFWEGDSGGNPAALIRSGLADLDALIEGFSPSNLIVVAAQTSMGKSTFLLNLARNAAVAQNARVAIFSLEMSEDEWSRRLLACESGVAIDRLKLGHMTNTDERAAMFATAGLTPLTIEICDRGLTTVEQMRSELRRMRARLGGLELVIVDYLQLIGNNRRHENRATEVGAISRALKMLAKELGVPVIAAAQLSREVDKRTPPVPRLSDLRESGAIEQDADIVMFLYRQDKHVRREDWRGPGVWPEGLTQVIVAKHRNGRTGSVMARMHDAIARVTDLTPPEEPDPQARFAEEAYA